MEAFLEKIYAIENFGTYILIAIGVLVVAFIVVLFLGKKDKKLEETRKLEALKKESKEEPKKSKEEKKKPKEKIKQEEMDILIPQPEKPEKEVDEKNEKLEEETKVEIKEKLDNPLEEKEKESVSVFEFAPEKEAKAPIEEIKQEPVVEPTPVVIPEPEVKPEPEVIPEPEVKPEPVVKPIPVEIPEPEPTPILEKEEIEIPEFNFDDLSTTLDEPKEVFSSVFTPEEERPVIRIVTPEKEDETPTPSSTEFDLPKLKEEDGFSFDQIEGEEYNINK